MAGTLPGYLYGLADRSGWLDRPVLTDERTGRDLTHRQVHAGSRVLARRLRDRGLGAGDRVGFCVGDGAGWFVAFLASARVGAVPFLVNPDVTPTMRQSVLEQCRATWLLDDEGDVLRLAARPTGLEARWHLDDLLTGLSFPEDAAEGVLGDEVLYGQLSSGATGAQKVVLHRARDLVAYSRAVAALEITPDDRILSVSQLYFAYGFNNQFVYPMTYGCHVTLRRRRRTADDVLAVVGPRRTTLLFSVPSALGAFDGQAPERHHVRGIVSAGEPLAATLQDRLERTWGTPVLEQIGCTEVGNAFCANGSARSSRYSTGFVSPGYEVELRPSTVELSAPDGTPTGEVWVRGESIPATAETADGPVPLLRDGWLRTGDLGHWNADGALVVLGRHDDILLVRGISVSAVRIEAVIRRTGLVADAAVASVVDERGVSSLAALVVPADGFSADDVLRLLAGRVADSLERFELPRQVVATDAIPRTPSGKLQRHRVRAAIDAGLNAPAVPV
ncbi:class I adenylate-forming enzyme family protein [Cellulomonas sp. URHD0024]|uniref:class I adenylate-forming enzyme family protein n=1 Tax=Cellulomonas sp. URHD0024 TaxID=1302620 RepID=UPI0004169515|nr:AMP-binding protein [Cellulomonas sp. URHD0024]